MTNKIRTMFTATVCAAALMLAGQATAMSGKPDDSAKPIDYVVTAMPQGEQVNRVIILGDSLSDDGGDNSTWFLLKTLNGQTGQAGINHMQPFVNSWLSERIPTYSWWCSWSWANCPGVEGGILNALTKITETTGAIPIAPGDHYDNGRWSNGKMWPEYLAPMMGISTSDKNRYRNVSHAGGWSLCVGDKVLGIRDLAGGPKKVAMNMVNGSLIPPCLKLITKSYLYEHGGFEKGDMAVVFFGGNDYLNVYQDPARVVQAQKEVVEMAADNGASNVVWLNMPDIANTPKFITGSAQADSAVVSNLISQHNQLMYNEYQGLKNKYASQGVKIIHIDAKKIFDDIRGDYQNNGFTVIDQPCSTIPTPGLDDDAEINPTFAAGNAMAESDGQVCQNQDQYMFWDSVHPTTATHRLIADRACDLMKEQGFRCNK